MNPLQALLTQAKAKTGIFALDLGTNTMQGPPVHTPSPIREKPGMFDAKREGPDPLEGINIRYITSEKEAAQTIPEIIAKAGDTVCGFDIETAKIPEFASLKTAGLEPHQSKIRLGQFYLGDDNVLIFDMFKVSAKALAPLMDLNLVAHNAKFEVKHLLHCGLYPKMINCTMLMAQTLFGPQLWSLRVLADEQLGLKISKEFQASDWGAENLSNEQLRYAAIDAVVAHRLFHVLKPRIAGEGLEMCYCIMRNALKAVGRMELSGIQFDLVTHTRLISQWETEKLKAESELRELLGDSVNMSSSKQLSDWLKPKLPRDIGTNWPKTDCGQLKTDADTLKKFSAVPVVRPILKYREVEKLLSTYGTSYSEHINPATGRIHADFFIGGARTGRFSCRSPNIQNPPRGETFRSLFTASEGYEIVVADYSQIELRGASMISGDERMLKAYEEGDDLHMVTASKISGLPYDKITKELRQKAKAINFGLIFGQGAAGLAAYAKSAYSVDMSIEEAEKARRTFFQTYPSLAKWQSRIVSSANKFGMVRTVMGRTRDFRRESRKRKKRVYSEAMNTPIQGTAAEVLMLALHFLEEGCLRELDAKLVNIVHDEIVMEVAKKDVETAKKALEKAMIDGFKAVFPKGCVTNLVEAGSGRNWYEAKAGL